MAPELVAGGGYGGLIREKPHCAVVRVGTTPLFVRPAVRFTAARAGH